MESHSKRFDPSAFNRIEARLVMNMQTQADDQHQYECVTERDIVGVDVSSFRIVIHQLCIVNLVV